MCYSWTCRPERRWQMVRLAVRAEPLARAHEGQITEEFAMHNLSRRNAVRLVLLVAAAPFATSMPFRCCGKSRRWRSRAMTRSPISPSESPRAGCRRSNTNGMSTATAFRARSIASFSRPIPCATRRSSQTSAPWRSPRGEIDEANPENWLISDGKLYIFGRADRDRPVPAGPCRKHRQGEPEPAAHSEALAVSCRGEPAWRARGRPCASRRASARDRPRSETWSRTPADRRSGRCGVSSATTRAASSDRFCCA